MMKHDPSYHVAQSMKLIFVKSSQRLRSVQANKPKYLHSRFNIRTLTTSPLMVFPHFEDMTEYLSRWFLHRDDKQRAVKTSSQRALFDAQDRFANALFLLLQESARANPISPKPLKGIYNWYLERDSVITSTRTFQPRSGVDDFLVIELSNGKEIRIPRSLLDFDSACDKICALFDPKALSERFKDVPLDDPVLPPPERAPTPPHHTEIIAEVSSSPQQKRTLGQTRKFAFNFERFNQEMDKQKKAEGDMMALRLVKLEKEQQKRKKASAVKTRKGV
jgi:hypothetical protein